MLKEIKYESFKSLSDVSIKLGKISVFAGLNSAGKSSAIQGLLLARALADHIQIRGGIEHGVIEKFELNGNYLLSLGSPSETITRATGKEFSITLSEGEKIFTNRFYLSDAFSDVTYSMSVELSEVFKDSSIFKNDFYYLNAERLGPRVRHWVNERGGKLHCGYRGEYTIEVLARTKDTVADREYDVDEAKLFEGKKIDGFQTIPKYVGPWMDFITPNTSIGDAEILGKIRSSMISFNGNTPPNVGFGISYVLPIVVTGLLAKPGSLMLVENPEAHLHPKGQSNIGFFLGQMASAGIQVIVETHSEHVINGIRKASLALSGLSPQEFKISFFSGLDSNKTATVAPIEVYENGDLSDFPIDFFDQVRQDLAEIRGIVTNRK